MSIIQPAIQAVRNWASFGITENQAVAGTPFRKERKPFDELYPRPATPLRYNQYQLADLRPRLGFSTVSGSEIELALSRTPSDLNLSLVASHVQAVISAFRAEHPSDSTEAAARELVRGSKALSDIDNRLLVAQAATEQARKEQRDFELSVQEFRSIPARHEHLVAKIAGLELQAKQIQEADYDAQIMQHLTLQYNPKPGIIIAGSIGELVVAKQTRDLKLRVIAGILEQCRTALSQLLDDNRRLAQSLDMPEHRL